MVNDHGPKLSSGAATHGGQETGVRPAAGADAAANAIDGLLGV